MKDNDEKLKKYADMYGCDITLGSVSDFVQL